MSLEDSTHRSLEQTGTEATLLDPKNSMQVKIPKEELSDESDEPSEAPLAGDSLQN